LGIVPYPIYTYIDFSYYWFLLPVQLKSDDISVLIMVQVLPINVQQVIIGAKDIVQGYQGGFLLLKNGPDKGFKCQALL
jgi:hypothetical protein